MKKQEIKFEYKGFEHSFEFTPTESDWWTGFESNGMSFDVHYYEDDEMICVYEVIDGNIITSKTIHSQEIEIDENDLVDENTFFVDVPRSDVENSEWINVESFKTREQAIKFAMEHFGADENGMICIISEC